MHLANTQKDKTSQESTPINNTFYFSSEVKMGGSKEKWGPKKKWRANFFRAEISVPHFQFAPYVYEFNLWLSQSVRLWHWYTSVAKRILIIKIQKIWTVDSQENY